MFSSMKYVYEVYKEHSFSKAAQNLYISQPSLSNKIKKVEAKVGAALFERNTIPLRLTDCGEKYIECAKQIMEIEHSFADYLYNANKLKTGRITIGGSQFFISFILPSILEVFKQKYPQVDIVISEASSVALEEQLFNGSLDLAVDSNALSSDIYERFLCREERLVLAVPASHKVNSLVSAYQLTLQDILENRHCSEDRNPVPMKFFVEEPFILLGPGNDSRKRADQLFADQNMTPKILVQPEQQFTAYILANNGMGATIVSDALLRCMAPSDKLVYYKLPDNFSQQSLYFYYKHNRYVTPTMHRFLEVAQSLLADDAAKTP